MARLLSVAEEDGYAFVEIDQLYFAVRPPFTEWQPVPLSAVERSVTIHGFTAVNAPEEERHEVVQRIKKGMSP